MTCNDFQNEISINYVHPKLGRIAALHDLINYNTL